MESIEYAAIDIGMKRHLYGLTLYILGFLVSQILPLLQKTQLKIEAL